MFRDQKGTTDSHWPTRDAHTIPDDAIVLTANFLPHETRACLPEMSLVAAVFEDALRCVRRGSRGVTRRQSSEAFEWIASERRDWPFAFVTVCDLLGVDAKAVRQQLGIVEEGSGQGSSARVIE